MENLSPTVLLRMVEFLQQELTAANNKVEQLTNISNAQKGVIQTLKTDLANTEGRLDNYIRGTEIITHSVDGMFQHANHLHLIQRMEDAEWDEFMRQMMRADLGFAIVHGVWDGLQANEELTEEDGETTEEEEMED